jgi:lipopolysaccharide export system permease protein
LTLERYILRQLLVGLVFAVGGMVFIAIPGILVSAVHKLAGVGVGPLLGFVPLVVVELLPYLVPIGLLLATVATFGRMAADNEWTAIQMAGFHPLRMVRPAALLAVLLGLALHWVVCNVSPRTAYLKSDYAKNSVVRMLKTLDPGRTELRFGEFYLSARSRDAADRSRFFDAFIHVPAKEGEPPQTVLAASAEFTVESSRMRIDLENARWVRGGGDARVGRAAIELDLDLLFPDSANKSSWKFAPSGELRRRIARTEAAIAAAPPGAKPAIEESPGWVPPRDLDRAWYEVHQRDAIAAVCPMFLILGVATGLILRRGSQLVAFATAVAYALAYYLLSMRFGKALAVGGAVPQWLAAWATTIVGSVVGLALLRRALWR